ncbi:hypothetical protein E4U16_005457 [Claviceps sp. LM84 group G4]|nr:hypothetical protein E4U16_005457 [Claviceps sp. LM84 group G4]
MQISTLVTLVVSMIAVATPVAAGRCCTASCGRSSSWKPRGQDVGDVQLQMTSGEGGGDGGEALIISGGCLWDAGPKDGLVMV